MTHYPIILFPTWYPNLFWVQSALKDQMIWFFTNCLRRSIGKSFSKQRSQVDSISYLLPYFINTIIITIGLSWIFYYYEHRFIRLMKPIQNTKYHIFILFVSLIWISYSMKSHSPLSWSIDHFKPNIVSIIKLT